MKKVTLLAIASVTLFACGGGRENSSNVELTTEIDSVSYAIGASQAKGLMTQVPELNVAAFMKGYKDVADSNDLVISDADAQVMLQAFGQRKQVEAAAKQQAEQEAMYGNLQEEGLKFLAENKTKEGVQVTASGLQYIVLKEGTGVKPTTASTVTAHYVGMFTDGSVFESSVEKGQPIDFPVTGVIAGWTEGLQLMKEGAKYKFFIPQELAYGANPNPNGPIKPYQTLVFEVELIKVK